MFLRVQPYEKDNKRSKSQMSENCTRNQQKKLIEEMQNEILKNYTAITNYFSTLEQVLFHRMESHQFQLIKEFKSLISMMINQCTTVIQNYIKGKQLFKLNTKIFRLESQISFLHQQINELVHAQNKSQKEIISLKRIISDLKEANEKKQENVLSLTKKIIRIKKKEVLQRQKTISMIESNPFPSLDITIGSHQSKPAKTYTKGFLKHLKSQQH